MKLLSFVVSLILVFSSLPASAQAVSTVVISEVQTGSLTSSNEEFIELYNNSETAVNLSGWRLEYHPATRTNFDNPSHTTELSGTLQPGKHHLLTRTNYLTDVADQHFGQSIAESGGHIRLAKVDTVSNVLVTQDALGWGTAKFPEGTAVQAAGDGKSLVRKSIESGGLQDTGNNADDFVVNSIPSPVADNEEPVTSPPEPEEPPATDPEPDPEPELPPEEENDEEGGMGSGLLPLQITELLPDPAAPATDDEDEFVEIYNPNGASISLAGWQIETGSSFSYRYTITDAVIQPNGYLAFYSKDTDLILSNSGGKARLLDDTGVLVFETEAYGAAPQGQSWVLLDGKWQWTTTLTPAAQNVVTAPVPKAKSVANPLTKKASAKKKVSSKVASAKTKKAKKAAAKKASKPKKSKAKNSAVNQPAMVVNQAAPIHPFALGAVGASALLYGAYEYRGDIRNYIRRIRRN